MSRSSGSRVRLAVSNVASRIAAIRLYMVGGLEGHVIDLITVRYARVTSAVLVSTKAISTDVCGTVRRGVFGTAYATYRNLDAAPNNNLGLLRKRDRTSLIGQTSAAISNGVEIVPNGTSRDILRLVLNASVDSS